MLGRETAMQELRWFISDGLNGYDVDMKPSEVWAKVNSLLEKEEAQIKEAYLQGDEDGYHSSESVSDYECLSRSKHVSDKYFKSVYKSSTE